MLPGDDQIVTYGLDTTVSVTATPKVQKDQVCAVASSPEGVVIRVERYGSRATVSFEFLNIRIPLKFVRIQQNYQNFSEILTNFRTSQHFLECSAKFRKN